MHIKISAAPQYHLGITRGQIAVLTFLADTHPNPQLRIFGKPGTDNFLAAWVRIAADSKDLQDIPVVVGDGELSILLTILDSTQELQPNHAKIAGELKRALQLARVSSAQQFKNISLTTAPTYGEARSPADAEETESPSLGQRLKDQLEKSAEAKRKAAAEAEVLKTAAKQESIREVREFFESAKRTFSQNIADGVRIKGIEVRYRGGNIGVLLDIYGKMQINASGHRYHDQWREFEAWAAENGLVALWGYEHDGMGIESWYVLSVAPQ